MSQDSNPGNNSNYMVDKRTEKISPLRPRKKYKVKIWKLGTILNGLYIGLLPQCILLFTDYYKGVPSWGFAGTTSWEQGVMEDNDALIKHPYGNTILSIAYFWASVIFS